MWIIHSAELIHILTGVEKFPSKRPNGHEKENKWTLKSKEHV